MDKINTVNNVDVSVMENQEFVIGALEPTHIYSKSASKDDVSLTNLSTPFGAKKDEKSGFDYIIEAMKKLEEKHKEHIEIYGTGNELRLTGKYETSDINKFSYGVGSRNTSVRIDNKTEKERKGYFEDRRPSSNMDPYLVCAKIVETILI